MTTCGTCRYYHLEDSVGKCKITHTDVIIMEDGTGHDKRCNGWPRTKEDSIACGEWKIRN